MADQAKFLADIQNADKDVRFAAWRSAGEQDAAVLPELARVAGDAQPGVRKAALEAMSTLTHSVGKSAGATAAEVSKQLMAVASSAKFVNPVRTHALRLLSLIGGDEAVAPASKLLADADLREEAIFCLERIPGDASAQAITAAYATAPAEFKGRVLAALGHRRIESGVPHTVAAMRSADKELSLSGLRAYGRIGKKPATPVTLPAMTGLSGWQTIEYQDSRLRYADAQAAAGNTAEAMAVYKLTLARPEEHLQCAALIGIGKIGTPEAAATIHPLLKSPSRKVRITAGQVWIRMAASM